MNEHDLYPVHEEDNVPEKGFHEAQARYLKGALAAHLRDKWVTGDICMYWEERNFHQYAAPDALVVDCPTPDPIPKVYLRWSDPEPLLVIEVGSRSTFRMDEGPKTTIYGGLLRVPEYLYYHPDLHTLTLYVLKEHGYEAAQPDDRGRLHSQTLDLWFGVDDGGWLRIYTPAGERLLTHEEEAEARREAERARQGEAEARQAAERARQREAEARREAERRIAELEAELQRLRGQRSAG